MREKAGRRGNGITIRIMIIFGVLLLPMYALLIVSAKSYLNAQESSAVNAAAGILELNINSLESECGQINYAFYDLQEYDSNYSRICNWTGSGEDYLAWMGVNRSLISLGYDCEIKNILFLYLDKTDEMLLISNDAEPSEKVYYKQAIRQENLLKRTLKWQLRQIDGKSYLLHVSESYGAYVGILMDLDKCAEQLTQQIRYDDTKVYVDTNPLEWEDAEYITISRQIGTTDAYIHVQLDKNEISSTIPQIVRITYRVALLFILIFPILFAILWHMIVRPIRLIEKGIHKLEAGEQGYQIPYFKASSEFESLRASFNSMAGEIRNLKIASYEEQLERKQMEMQNLLLQIRPHFMLNIINQIFSMAQLRDYEGIQKMSVYLSRFFRHLFHGEKLVTLYWELELVHNYLEMMELRFAGCFEVEEEIDENLLQYEVPPLMIHNFVENIFKYAVREGNIITIRLSLQQRKDEIEIMIADDGPGMDAQTLEKIQAMQPIKRDDGTHIGIYNSAYRLKTLCEENSRLQVDSVLTEGTTVRIYLPALDKTTCGKKEGKHLPGKGDSYAKA